MSDVTPSPVKGGQPNQQKQLIMVAVLGIVLLAVLVFMVLKPFGGGDDTSAPPAPAVTAPAADAGTGATAAPAAGGETETTEPAPPPARPARTPFDPPR